MQNSFWTKTLRVCGAVFLATIAFFAGLYVDAKKQDVGTTLSALSNREAKVIQGSTDLSTFWEVWSIIDHKFVPTHDATTTTSNERVYGAIKGMVDSLGDPYTTFLDPEEAKTFEDDLSGSLEGIGVVLGIREEFLTVISPLKGSPADKAGIREGDRIIKINGEDAIGFSTEEAVKLIRGKKGTSVTLTISRGDQKPFDVTVVRDVINVPVLETEKLPDGVFKITVHSFTSNVDTLFRAAIDEFAASKSTRLVIDLRNNPGGYLDAAIDIASYFIPAGKVVVSEDFGNGKQVVSRSKGYKGVPETTKIAVLINEGSASASEIVAGALNDYDRAILVGGTTFGKGSVQELIPLDGNASLKVTIARWFTPNGANLSEGGLKPDIEVQNTEEDVKAKRDVELEKAIEAVKKIN